jgi:2-methylisocitrate lyase-like PEP mutase family enzyme
MNRLSHNETTRLHPLHGPGRLLVLPNVWDALSARLVEESGAEAIATASASISWAHGHPDGEALPLDDLVRAVARITHAVRLPVTVDLERGYAADPEGAADAVARVVAAGAEGVNLEDGGGAAETLAAKIAAVRRRLGERVFVNARTCVALHGQLPPNQTAREVIARAKTFAESGADGLFVPGLVDADAIRAIAHATPLPLNVLLRPGLPPLAALRDLGVRRLSTGPRLAAAAYALARHAARDLLAHGAYGPLLDADLTYPEANALFAPRSE